MLAIYIIVALFIAFIWIDYFRRIDIFEKEKWYYYLVVFALGAASVLIVDAFSWIMSHFNALELNDTFWNDFFFCVINIGMVEEFAKSVPFILIFIFFRRLLNEPLDYLIVFCVSALGFAATENVLYFNHYGSQIIIGRSALSAVSHMFDSALVAYGVILSVYRYKNHAFFLIPAFFLLAALAHGFYDFWLIFAGFKTKGWIVTYLYFIVTLSWFSTILNNAQNQSPYFTYKKDIQSDKLGTRMFYYYLALIGVQFLLIWFQGSLQDAVLKLISSIFLLILIFIIVFRLSRFRFIKSYWHKFRIDSPFDVVKDINGVREFGFRGETTSESALNMYIEEYVILRPVSSGRGRLNEPVVAYITGKNFARNLDGFFKVKVFLDNELSDYFDAYLFLKSGGLTITKNKNRIFLLAAFEREDYVDFKFEVRDFSVIDWVVVEKDKIEN
jgi:RsiW-degrading membrane proteinase PrsW (M82 family)